MPVARAPSSATAASRASGLRPVMTTRAPSADEPLGRCQSDATAAASDDGDLVDQLTHSHFSFASAAHAASVALGFSQANLLNGASTGVLAMWLV